MLKLKVENAKRIKKELFVYVQFRGHRHFHEEPSAFRSIQRKKEDVKNTMMGRMCRVVYVYNKLFYLFFSSWALHSLFSRVDNLRFSNKIFDNAKCLRATLSNPMMKHILGHSRLFLIQNILICTEWAYENLRRL